MAKGLTEPPREAGSDPGALSTMAVRDGNDYVITGRKWFITGAVGAGFAIIMAKGEDGKATMFLSDMDRPEIRVERVMDTMDQGFAGQHAVLSFYRVADRCVQVLGGQGVSGETVVERIFREVRAFRVYDGPSEVHRWSLAQKLVKHGANR